MSDIPKAVEQKLRNILEENISNLDVALLVVNSNLYETLGIDSMDLISLIMVLEDEFGIELPESAMDEIETFGDLVEWISGIVEIKSCVAEEL